MVASVFFIQALLALTLAAPINDSVKVSEDGEVLMKDTGSVILRDVKDEKQAEQLLTHAISPDDVNMGIHGLLKLGERPHEMEQENPPCVPIGSSGPHGPIIPVGPIPAGGNHHHQPPHHHNNNRPEPVVEGGNREEPHSPSTPSSPCPPCAPPAPSSKPKCEHRVPFQQGEYALYLDTPCSDCPRESTQRTEPHYTEPQPQPQHPQPQQPCPPPVAPPSWPMPPHQMVPHHLQYGPHESAPYMSTAPPHHQASPFEFGHQDTHGSMNAPHFPFEFGHHDSRAPPMSGAPHPAHYDYGRPESQPHMGAPHFPFDFGRHESHPQMVSAPNNMEAGHPAYSHHPSLADLFRPQPQPEHEYWSQYRNAIPHGASHEAAHAPRGPVAHPFAQGYSHPAHPSSVEYVSPEVAVPGYIPPVVQVPAHGMETERSPYGSQEPMPYSAASGAPQYPAMATVKKPSPHELHRRAIEYPAQSYTSNRGYVQEVPVCETRNGGVQYSAPVQTSCNTCEEPIITVAQANCNERYECAEPVTDIYGNIGCYAQIGNQLAADSGRMFRHVFCPWSFFAMNCDQFGDGACGTTAVNCDSNACGTVNCETTICGETQCNPCETCPQGYYLNNGVCYPQECQTECVQSCVQQEVPICAQKVNQPCYQQQTVVKSFYPQQGSCQPCGQVCTGPLCQQGPCQPRVIQQVSCQQPRFVQQQGVCQQGVCQQGPCQPRFVQQQGVCQQGNCQTICEQPICEPLCEKPCEPLCEQPICEQPCQQPCQQPCEQVANNCNGNRPANNYDQQLECYEDVGNGVAEESGRCIRWLLCPWSWFGDNFDNGVAKARAAHRNR